MRGRAVAGSADAPGPARPPVPTGDGAIEITDQRAPRRAGSASTVDAVRDGFHGDAVAFEQMALSAVARREGVGHGHPRHPAGQSPFGDGLGDGSATAEPRPPAAQCSSTVTMWWVVRASAYTASVSRGLTVFPTRVGLAATHGKGGQRARPRCPDRMTSWTGGQGRA